MNHLLPNKQHQLSACPRKVCGFENRKRMRTLQVALIPPHLFNSFPFLHSHVSNRGDMTLCAVFDATKGLRLAPSRGLSCSTQRVGRTGAPMFDGVGVSGLSGNGAHPSGSDPRDWIFCPQSIIHRTEVLACPFLSYPIQSFCA